MHASHTTCCNNKLNTEVFQDETCAAACSCESHRMSRYQRVTTSHWFPSLLRSPHPPSRLSCKRDR
jgi:hypothetical protein